MYCICLHCPGSIGLFRGKCFILKDPPYTFCLLRLELLVILKDITDFHSVISLISEGKYSQIGQTPPPNSTIYFGWGNSFYIPLVGTYLGERAIQPDLMTSQDFDWQWLTKWNMLPLLSFPSSQTHRTIQVFQGCSLAIEV